MRKTCPSVAGFTLIEIVVVIAILITLTVVALPLTDGIADARETRVLADTTTLGGGLLRYMQDTRFRPTGDKGQATYDHLLGDLGETPAFDISGSFTSDAVGIITRSNTWNSRRWRGPYLEPMPPDPWGFRYVAWVRNFNAGKPVWVISAGPDGRIQTGPDAMAIMGDDIGMAVE